jgi:hypothetical protein
MKAHTTNRLIDPKTVKERKTYRTVDEYEAARAAETDRGMSDRELQYRQQQELLQQQQEEERIQRLQSRDQRVEQHFQRVSQLRIQ